MLELTQYRARLIDEGFGEIPLDGGTAARVLFLFEKLGPKTSLHGGGSGFISRDNDDATAKATFNFMRLATIPREAPTGVPRLLAHQVRQFRDVGRHAARLVVRQGFRVYALVEAGVPVDDWRRGGDSNSR
jgi:hypothetical protein